MNPWNRSRVVAPSFRDARSTAGPRRHGDPLARLRITCAPSIGVAALCALATVPPLAAQETHPSSESGSPPASSQTPQVSPTRQTPPLVDSTARPSQTDTTASFTASGHGPVSGDAPGGSMSAVARGTRVGGSSADPVSVAARDYAVTGVAATVREGASVTYPYGHAQPTLTCAPLRACVIELEAGEVVLSRIAGDTQRWEIAPAVAGPDGRTPLIVVKPHDCGLTTNLVLSTTRGRIYDLTLDSRPCPARGPRAPGPPNPEAPYTRHVRFYYPDDLVEGWTAAPIDSPRTAAQTPPVVAASVETFNFSYHVDREKSFPWTPLAVFDDGAHCYIKLPASAAHTAAPALFLVASDGSKTLLNYALSGDTYITDRVFHRAVLVVGVGGREAALRLENRDSRTPEAE